MSEEIEFVLRGKVDGVAITPRTIGLSQYNESNQQVEALSRAAKGVGRQAFV